MGDIQKFAVLEIREGLTWVEDSQEVLERTAEEAVKWVHYKQANQDPRDYAVYCYETATLSKLRAAHSSHIHIYSIE